MQAQNDWRKKYESVSPGPGPITDSPVIRSNKSMVAPWEGSVWDSDKWKREQVRTNEMLL